MTPLSKGDDNAGYTSALAYALRLRGADPLIVSCDAWLDGCEVASIHRMTPSAFIRSGPRPLCEGCTAQAQRIYGVIGLPVAPLSSLLSPVAAAAARQAADAIRWEDYLRFSYKGVELGPQVEASLARFFYLNVIDLTAGPNVEEMRGVGERMVRGAVMMAEAVLELARRFDPEIFLIHYGAYLARGTATAVVNALGRRCVVWSRGYGVKETLYFGDRQNAHMEFATRSSGPWDDTDLSPEQEAILDGILGSRVVAHARFRRQPLREDEAAIASELRLDMSRPVVALYTNVGFDTKLFYDTPEYPNVNDWIFDSIELFAGRREQLVIRVHPGELWLPEIDKEQTTGAIRERFPRLPENVRVVAPDDPMSSYALARLSDAAITYGSLIGLELAAGGVPVISCGRAPYGRKGFTYDVRSRDEYRAVVERLEDVVRPDPERVRRARRFAYYLYHVRNIPFAVWNHDLPARRLEPWWRRFRSLSDLRPGRDPNLDAICDQILHGEEAHSLGFAASTSAWDGQRGAQLQSRSGDATSSGVPEASRSGPAS